MNLFLWSPACVEAQVDCIRCGCVSLEQEHVCQEAREKLHDQLAERLANLQKVSSR